MAENETQSGGQGTLSRTDAAAQAFASTVAGVRSRFLGSTAVAGNNPVTLHEIEWMEKYRPAFEQSERRPTEEPLTA